jgi:hypothetical protein
VHWPRPTVADLDELWLAELGAPIANAILFDRVVFDDESDTTDRGTDTRRSRRGAGAPSFQVRAGDFAWHGGSYVALDAAALARNGLAARVLLAASPRAWSFAWDGGNLPADVLAGPTELAPARAEAPLVVEVTGAFPSIDENGLVAFPSNDENGAVRASPSEKEGRLVLAASSQFLANGNLHDARFGAPEFLVETVAGLALPSEIAALAAHGSRPPRLEDVDEDVRLAWRAFVTSAAPVAALVLWLLRCLWRASLRRRERRWRAERSVVAA